MPDMIAGLVLAGAMLISPLPAGDFGSGSGSDSGSGDGSGSHSSGGSGDGSGSHSSCSSSCSDHGLTIIDLGDGLKVDVCAYTRVADLLALNATVDAQLGGALHALSFDDRHAKCPHTVSVTANDVKIDSDVTVK